MDWSHYSALNRASDKIYEDSYISSWGIENGTENSVASLKPLTYEEGVEKARIVECANSNKYNITQTIAEQFGVFCVYEYKCDGRGQFIGEYKDDKGWWTGRKVIFYNRAIKADEPLFFEYQKNLTSFSRTNDSSEIYTKLYVTPIDSQVLASGLASIADTPINPLMDDFILNFDYLYETGGITQYQYNQVKQYEVDVHNINTELANLAPIIDELEIQINEIEAETALIDKSIQELEEELSHYETLRNNPVTSQTVTKNKDNPCSVVFVERDGCLTADLRLEGIDKTSIQGFKDNYKENNELFRSKEVSDTLKTNTYNAKHLRITNIKKALATGNQAYYLLQDKYGFPCEIYTGLRSEKDETKPVVVFLNLKYNPSNKYAAICDQLIARIAEDTELKQQKENEVSTLQAELDELFNQRQEKLDNKEQLTLRLERILGPALREGYWNPDSSYDDPGEHVIKSLSTKPVRYNEGTHSRGNAYTIWDDKPFEGEEVGYYYTDPLDSNVLDVEKKSYYYFNIWLDMDNNDSSKGKRYENILSAANLKNLVIIAKDSEAKATEGKREMWPDRVIYYNAGYIITFFDTWFKNKEIDNPTDPTDDDLASTPAIRPIILFNDSSIGIENYSSYEYAFLDEDGTIQIDEEGKKVTHQFGSGIIPKQLRLENEKIKEKVDKLVYPRIYINNPNVNYKSDLLKIEAIDERATNEEDKVKTLEKFLDYSILTRKNEPYITLKPSNAYPINFLMDEIPETKFKIYYQISRAAEMLYLDAKQVAYDYSRPRYSYQVDISNAPNNIASIDLGQLVYINDQAVGAHAVTGYVSSISFNLEKPSEDGLTIQNYKTKFEDLFSSISAQSEAMKNNSRVYNIAAGAFDSSGQLSGDVLQNTINSNNISMNFSSTNVEISPTEGIILTNASPYLNGVYGQVALRGGGIFLSSAIDDHGQRIWSTGITPSGINASHITSGKIDTSNIRILAGDNVTFQWNSEGIFAYKYDEEKNNNVDLSTYVKFSQYGVQYIDNGYTAVDLGWNGLLISTQGGATELTGGDGLVVYNGEKDATGSNKVIQVGKLNDKQYGMRLLRPNGDSGYIETLVADNTGSLWLKDTLRVGHEDGIAGITGADIIPVDETSSIRFWAGSSTPSKAPFWVLQDGSLKATAGSIGGWKISKNSISSNGIKLNSAYMNESNELVGAEIRVEGKDANGNNKSVIISSDGSLYANGATINGTIHAEGGTIGGLQVNTIVDSIEHYTVEISSSNGNITESGASFSTTFIATVKKGGIELTDKQYGECSYKWLGSADGDNWLTISNEGKGARIYEYKDNSPSNNYFIKCMVTLPQVGDTSNE